MNRIQEILGIFLSIIDVSGFWVDGEINLPEERSPRRSKTK
ncbi:MAG: hypothetical protein BWX76_00818 [Candidatus Cloacimonetes bacterium ADurb.Bin089]|jgi:hypothetical protein|nr:MAG: hypothetical protein BWX76_00818 [Candidatus Cloacimonetes bacterium ADurb.Bin089]